MSRGWRIALLVGVAFGLALRCYVFFVQPPTLWQDEAYWAVKALKTEAIDAQIRPLGFMLITQLLLRTFGAAAWVYRIQPFLGGLLAMGLVPYVARRLFQKPWSQLLAVLLLAVSPVALEMCAEFKHYGTEIGAYVGVLAALLRHQERPSWRTLALVLGAAWCAFFVSITIIFLYPALFGVLGWQAYRSKRWRELMAISGVVLICLGSITTIYFTTWRGISANKAENKWGTWYDVFYIKNGLKTTHDSRFAWTAAKYFELGAVPGIDRELWQATRISEPSLERLKVADIWLWGALHVLGLAWLARKRRYLELLALWSPLLMLTAFNLAGRWPAGAFRSNTFYVPFAIFIACAAAEWLPDEKPVQRRLAFGLAGALWLSTLFFRPSLTRKGLWTKPGAFTEALALLPRDPARGQRTLLMDFESCRPWDYYTAYDVPFSNIGSGLRRRYDKQCERTGVKLKRSIAQLQRSRPDGFKILLTDPRKFQDMEDLVKQVCAQSTVTYVHGRTHQLSSCIGRK